VGFGVVYLSELGKFDGLKGEIGDERGSHAFFVLFTRLPIIETMSKIFLNTRDQLVVVNPDLIAAVRADGNYTRVLYINKREINITVGISKLETILKSNRGKKNSFIRLGRSIIINHSFLYKIDIPTQQIVLSDGSTQELRIKVSKKLLKPYKEATVQSVLTQSEYGKEDNTGN